MQKISVAGVPEHFNIPLSDEDTFKSVGLEVEFKQMRGGTGQMVEALVNGEVDVVMALTDGLIKSSCSKDSPVRLCGVWVSSPLVWALAAKRDAANPVKMDKENIKDRKFGVSRMGSGSHTMGYLLREQQGLTETSDELFIIAKDIDGLTSGVLEDKFDCFLWETHMMQPYFEEKGGLCRVGEIPTPWPAFCIAVNNKLLTDEKAVAIKEKLLPGLAAAAGKFKADKAASVKKVVEVYGLKQDVAEHWFDAVSYRDDTCKTVPTAMLESVMNSLKGMKLITEKVDPSQLIDPRITSCA